MSEARDAVPQATVPERWERCICTDCVHEAGMHPIGVYEPQSEFIYRGCSGEAHDLRGLICLCLCKKNGIEVVFEAMRARLKAAEAAIVEKDAGLQAGLDLYIRTGLRATKAEKRAEVAGAKLVAIRELAMNWYWFEETPMSYERVRDDVLAILEGPQDAAVEPAAQ